MWGEVDSKIELLTGIEATGARVPNMNGLSQGTEGLAPTDPLHVVPTPPCTFCHTKAVLAARTQTHYSHQPKLKRDPAARWTGAVSSDSEAGRELSLAVSRPRPGRQEGSSQGRGVRLGRQYRSAHQPFLQAGEGK